MLAPELEATLNRALDRANLRRHEYATLEHLLLALLDDQDAASALRSCNANVETLRQELIDYLNTKLGDIVSKKAGSQAKPTAGFQRSLQRAAIYVQAGKGTSVNGTHLLVALLSERDSWAVHFLKEQGVTRDKLINL